MKVVILCGGKGTRLKETSGTIPKALVEVGGRPILWHIMKIYSAYGFSEFILCLGHKGQMIKEYFMESESWRCQDFELSHHEGRPEVRLLNDQPQNWKITFADTGEETPTGGRIKKIEPLIQEDIFMVTYGDGVSNIDITKLLEFHKRHGKTGTVTAVSPSSQFGLLDIRDDDQVASFREKPKVDQWINGGFFIFNKEFFKCLHTDDVLEQAPLENLAKSGELKAFRHKAYWQCLDTYKDTLALNELWAGAKPPWKIWND